MATRQQVRIRPTGVHHIPGVPAVEQDVSPERAAELLAYRPAAFTAAPPQTEPDPPAAHDETEEAPR